MKFRIPRSEVGLIVARYKRQGFRILGVECPTKDKTVYRMVRPGSVEVTVTFTSNGWCEVE